MLWYAAFHKEHGIHPVIDEPGMSDPKSMTGIRSGSGLPSDADQWPLAKVEDEERKTARKLEGLQDWMFEHRDSLRGNPVQYSALQDLLKRFERRLKRLKELKNALVR